MLLKDCNIGGEVVKEDDRYVVKDNTKKIFFQTLTNVPFSSIFCLLILQSAITQEVFMYNFKNLLRKINQ